MDKFDNLEEDFIELHELILEGIENGDWDNIQDALDYLSDMFLAYGFEKPENDI